jgi:hypothetical protein
MSMLDIRVLGIELCDGFFFIFFISCKHDPEKGYFWFLDCSAGDMSSIIDNFLFTFWGGLYIFFGVGTGGS